MTKKKRGQVPDTPWHKEFVFKEDDDPRRHKSRCAYIEGDNCGHPKCRAYMFECAGSAHCKYYREASENWQAEMDYRLGLMKEISIAEQEFLKRDKIPKSYMCPTSCFFRRSDGKCTKAKANEEKTFGSECPYYVSKYAGNNKTATQVATEKSSNKKYCIHRTAYGMCNQPQCVSFEKSCVKDKKVEKKYAKNHKQKLEARARNEYGECQYYRTREK